jgi:hypothetical protein
MTKGTIFTRSQLEDALELGRILAIGGLFGLKNPEQGATLVLMAYDEGVPVAEMRKRFHVMNSKQGSKLLMRAEYMLAEFRRLGGTYRWQANGDNGDQATIEVEFAGVKERVRFSMEDAERQGLVKADGNYKKNPGAMLRARVTSKAILMVCPEVLAGFATDGDPDTTVEIETKPEPSTAPRSDGSQRDSEPPAGVPSNGQGKATGEQIKSLMVQYDRLSIGPESQLRAIAATGARDMGDLTREGASKILDELVTILPEEIAEPEPEPEPEPDPADLLRATRLMLAQLAADPEGRTLALAVRKYLDEAGIETLDGLPADDLAELHAGLEAGDLTKFLEPAKN